MRIDRIKRYMIIAALLLSARGGYSTESTLWGTNGEKWDTTKIPDFTSAGYRNGKVALPNYPVSVNVKNAGAAGDGVQDDTRYLRLAIAQCGSEGAVALPAGTYKLTDTIQIKKSKLVLRGEGAGKTIIYFSKGLEELYPLYNGSQTSWSWEGAMLLFKGSITDVGIENLTILFPDSAWAGHNFHERGYNGIGFNGASHGWVRNVTITGADVGIWISSSATHITADHWTLDFGPVRGSPTLNGHHGVNCYGGYNLLSNFFINGRFIHDLSVESQYSRYNVFMKGKGKDLCFDHHAQDFNQRYNLFTEIDAGKGSHLYESGGNYTPRGVSFHETWWNIKSVQTVKWVTSMGTSTNNVEVGLYTTEKSALPDTNGNYFENIPPADIVPQNLYWAQMKLLHNIQPPESTAIFKNAPRRQGALLQRAPDAAKSTSFDLSGKRVNVPAGQDLETTSARKPSGCHIIIDRKGPAAAGRVTTP